MSDNSLSIEVTNQCNSDCSHCFARAGISHPSSLPVGLVKAIITEGYNAAYRHLHITGGEPLLWDGLHEVLDYASDTGYETIFLNTNGTLLTDAVISRLSLYNGLSISVSLDGPETLHDRIRGKGSYKRIVVGIEKLLNRNIDLFIFTTARKSFLPDLSFFAEDLYRCFPDIKYLVFIQLIRVTEDVYDLSKELLLPEDFVRLVRYVSLLNLCGFKSQVLNNPLAGLVSKMLEMPWMPPTSSLYSEGSIIVMANRDIAIAHSSRVSFGKYEFGMIEKVLSSDRYRMAIAPDKSTCPFCKYFKLCRKNGMIRPSQWYRDMHPEEPYCRRVLDLTASNCKDSKYKRGSNYFRKNIQSKTQ